MNQRHTSLPTTARPHTPSIGWWLSLVLVVLVPTTAGAAAATQLCLYQFKQKRYLGAASCFRDAITMLEAEAKGKPTKDQRVLLGKWHRNAALALRKQADRAKSVPQAAYLREQALQYINEYLRRQLHEDASQRRLATLLQAKLNLQIGYISLLVVTNAPKARVQIEGGYQFSTRRYTGKEWRLKLRPGTYSLLVRFPNKDLQTRQVVLKRGQSSMLLDVRPSAGRAPRPKPLRTHPPAAFALVGAGAGLVLVGGVLLGFSGTTHRDATAQRDALATRRTSAPDTLTVEETRALRGLVDSANIQSGLGIAFGVSGLAMAVAGIVWSQISTQEPRPPTPPANTKGTMWQTPGL